MKNTLSVFSFVKNFELEHKSKFLAQSVLDEIDNGESNEKLCFPLCKLIIICYTL